MHDHSHHSRYCSARQSLPAANPDADPVAVGAGTGANMAPPLSRWPCPLRNLSTETGEPPRSTGRSRRRAVASTTTGGALPAQPAPGIDQGSIFVELT